ncbi:hypothetical protein Dvina_27560 [Dactylosporangium vinaceum]|uniref:NB-ARC domain-containing protein n=1 Tax=Dactylosporangium vinaceum TaxID=53362 RepID=A0ABV5MCF2_9ACTN|nr:hypothetical protein [Dactylosporangium vinaceum]UAB92144.1 hypothetical protein Dvina_27560 [Dactylosporangium vinaceum]
MGGQDAVRGFEYQFLRTLEYAFAALDGEPAGATGVYVESPPAPAGGAVDAEAVDFAVYRDTQCLLAAQVKSTPLSAPAALAILLRLITGDAGRYVLLTNRAGLGELDGLAETLAGPPGDEDAFRAAVTHFARRSRGVREQLDGLDDDTWARLRRCGVGVDTRSTPDIRRALRETTRRLRRRVAATPGWDAAGLVLGHLLWDVLSTAAAPGQPLIALDTIRDALAVDNATLAAAVAGRGWTVTVNVPPRRTDVARPELVEAIAAVLPVPNPAPQVPVCVLHGLSGVGKTSLAAAWADDRGDDYRVVFWVDASSAGSMESSFLAVDAWLAANAAPAPAEAEVRDRVLTGLSRLREPWLLVFDNAADARAVKAWLPRTGTGHALVTTTDPSSWHGAYMTALAVPVMTGGQAHDLLGRRLGTGDPRIGALAERLGRWPLALELASAYLLDTHAGDLDAAGYEHLVLRALDDPDSVPPGYPRTLVGAVLLAVRRMEQRAGAHRAAKVARLTLRFAALLRPRQIPLHLLMACVFGDIEADLRGEQPAPAVYRHPDPPIGEILRELRRGSLIAVDEPVFGAGRTPTALDFSISMNEVVQDVIRWDVTREGGIETAVTQAGYFAQVWLRELLDADRDDLALLLAGHCCRLADTAIEHGIANLATALLWGNTAAALTRVEGFHLAATYLRAELAFLDTQQPADPALELDTCVQLAAVLARAADRPADAADPVCDLIERALTRYEDVTARDPVRSAGAAFTASVVVRGLAHDLPQHPRLQHMAARLGQLLRAAPRPVGAQARAVEVDRVNELLRDGADGAALLRIDELLATAGYGFYRATLMRLRAEAQVQLRDWTGASDSVRAVRESVESGAAHYVEVDGLVTNLAHAYFMQVPGPREATRLLSEVVSVADVYESLGNTFRPGDRDRVELCRAYLAAEGLDIDSAVRHLAAVDRRELSMVEAARPAGAPAVHWLMTRWAATLPPEWRGGGDD